MCFLNESFQWPHGQPSQDSRAMQSLEVGPAHLDQVFQDLASCHLNVTAKNSFRYAQLFRPPNTEEHKKGSKWGLLKLMSNRNVLIPVQEISFNFKVILALWNLL